jgi:hypothetical protein
METNSPTSESVWAAILETQRQLQENNCSHAETAREIKDLKESQAKTDRQVEILVKEMRESNAESAKLRKKLDNLAKMIGGVSTSHGEFAEEYFFNSFDNSNLEFFGEKFDRVEKTNKGKGPGEYDILLINGKSVALIEVKFKVREKYVSEMLKKNVTFRINFPEYKSHKLYLGIAAMAFDKKLVKDFTDEGIAVVKHKGGELVINDENLKVFNM